MFWKTCDCQRRMDELERELSSYKHVVDDALLDQLLWKLRARCAKPDSTVFAVEVMQSIVKQINNLQIKGGK